MSSRKVIHAERAPKCDDTLGQFLLIIYPYILAQAGIRKFKTIIDGTDVMPNVGSLCLCSH